MKKKNTLRSLHADVDFHFPRKSIVVPREDDGSFRMALEIYEGNQHKLSLSESTLAHLQDAERELRARTRRGIDPYATSSLEPAHARLWLEGLRRLQPALNWDPGSLGACSALIAVLTESIARNVTLLLEGD